MSAVIVKDPDIVCENLRIPLDRTVVTVIVGAYKQPRREQMSNEYEDCYRDAIVETLEKKNYAWLVKQAEKVLGDNTTDWFETPGTASQGQEPSKQELIDLLLEELSLNEIEELTGKVS